YDDHSVVGSVLWFSLLLSSFFFFTDPATTEIYTLSLHDALPISRSSIRVNPRVSRSRWVSLESKVGPLVSLSRGRWAGVPCGRRDRKSTRLNSSHLVISYAVFCLKKKKKKKNLIE